MKIIKKCLPKTYELVLESDCHLGNPCVDEDNIKYLVDYVGSRKNCFMTNIGDNIEAISPTDKRFSFSDTKYKSAHEQADAFIKLHLPIKNNIIAIGDGNHEKKLWNTFQVGRYISEELGVPFGDYAYKLMVYSEPDMNVQHKMYFNHGSRNFNSRNPNPIVAEANMKNSLKNICNTYGHGDCNLIAVGHVHKSLIVEPTHNHRFNDFVYTDEQGNTKFKQKPVTDVSDYVQDDDRWYISNPSLMSLFAPPGVNYTSYAEMFGYSPSRIGFTSVFIEDGKIVDAKFNCMN